MIDGHLHDETYLSSSPRRFRGSRVVGRIYSIHAENTDAFVQKFDSLEFSSEKSQIFLSRYPQSRLIDLLDISEIQCYWLTNNQGKGAMEPSLEKLNHFIDTTIESGEGTIFIEGIEWLTSLHGFDSVHSMIRLLSEKISMSQWCVYLSISPTSFDIRECSRIYREAPLFEPNQHTSIGIEQQSVADDNPIVVEHSANLEMDLNDDGTPKLVLLTRLPKKGFTKQILQRRILQWRRMGLDTSDIESSLYSEDIDGIYSDYTAMEEKIRRATELERYIIEHVNDSQERTIAFFRIRQLTGLDELEKQYFSQ